MAGSPIKRLRRLGLNIPRPPRTSAERTGWEMAAKQCALPPGPQRRDREPDGGDDPRRSEPAASPYAGARVGEGVFDATPAEDLSDEALRAEAKRTLLHVMRTSLMDPARVAAARSVFELTAAVDERPAAQRALDAIERAGPRAIAALVAEAERVVSEEDARHNVSEAESESTIETS